MISKNMNVLLVTSVLFIVFIESSLAIRCWDCESNTDIHCADPFNNRTIVLRDCRERCRKLVERVDGHMKYSRGCHDEMLNLQDAELEICYTDTCNSGHSQAPYLIMMLAAPILIGILNIGLHSQQS